MLMCHHQPCSVPAFADMSEVLTSAHKHHVQVQLHGGSVSLQVDDTTTHLVLLDGDGSVYSGGGGSGVGGGSRGGAADGPRPVDPSALLAAVSARLGGVQALRALRGGLQADQKHLVTARCGPEKRDK